jgi:hypothetical protein
MVQRAFARPPHELIKADNAFLALIVSFEVGVFFFVGFHQDPRKTHSVDKLEGI